MNADKATKGPGGAIKALLAIAIMALVCLAAVEALLHTHFRWTNGQWLFVSQRHFKVPYAAPVSDRRQYALRAGYKDETTSINELGFRGPLPTVSAKQPLICVIGDSVPYGAGVRDNETLSVHLSQALARAGRPATVLNGGVPSYNLRQALDRWRLDIAPRWKCDLLILNAANDVSLYDYYGKGWTPDHTWANVRFGASAPSWSSLVHYVRAAKRNFAPRTSTLPIEDFKQTLARELAANLSLPRSKGIPIILTPVVPCYYGNDRGDRDSKAACVGFKTFAALAKKWQPPIDAVNEILRSAANGKGVFYADTATLLDDVGRTGKFVDFIHFSNEGARAVAGFLSEFIIQQKLLEAGRAN